MGAGPFFFSRRASEDVLRISTPAGDALPDEASPSSSANRAVGLGPDLESPLAFFRIGWGFGLVVEAPLLAEESVDFESEADDSSDVLFVFQGGG